MRFLALFLVATLSQAAVDRIWLEERSDVAQGKAFGAAGPYEKIRARVYFSVDPSLPANQGIRDIDLAPKNPGGKVEFSADLYLLRPRDPGKANGTVLLDIANRGNKVVLATFDFGTHNPNDPQSEADYGDGFLLEKGFSVAWIGWQFDVPNRPDLIRLYAPVAKGVTGKVRAEFVPDAVTTMMPLSEREHAIYQPAGKEGELTVRSTPTAAPQAIAKTAWKLIDNKVQMDSGFKPGMIYEFVYTAKDPAITGLGLAAVRDIVSFFKYTDSPLLLGDQRRASKRVIGFGTSQSGRLLRHLLWAGFNADEKGRKVFDGVWANVAGAGRGSFNHRFGQPSRDGQPWANYLWPTDMFPFTDTEETDSLTGEKGALLTTAEKQNVVPKIFYTNGAYEYWGRAASLITTTPDGKQDVAPAPNTRIYFVAGAQHGSGSMPPAKNDNVQNITNTNDQRFVYRALLMDMDAWLRDGKEPPASRYPLVSKGEFMTFADRGKAPQPRGVYRLDFGSEFMSKGLVTNEPPKVGQPYAVLLPKLNADGNEMGGVNLPWVSVPLGRYAGWNPRAKATGAPDAMTAFIGSFFPYTKEEIAKRYPSREAYLEKITVATKQLVADRLALEQDANTMIERASKEWSYWMH